MDEQDRQGQSESNTVVEVSRDNALALIRGSMWLDPTANGFIPVRLPESAWSRVPNLWAREMFRMAAGVRLSFVTAATSFELEVSASVMSIAGGLLPAAPVAFDLSIDGVDHGAFVLPGVSVRTFDVSREPRLVEETPSQQATLTFEGLAAEAKWIELWFPANAVVEVTALRVSGPFAAGPTGQARWVHYGSSISHCREIGRPTKTWPAIAAQLGDLDLLNLGVGGNCHLDPFVARAIRDAPAHIITLEVGPNIVMDASFTRRTFGPALAGFLDTIRDGHPDTPLVVASPIVGPLLEHAAGPLTIDESGNLTARAVDDADSWPLLSLERTRRAVEDLVASRSESDRNLHHVDGLTLFDSDDSAELADGFHPTAQGYETLATRFAQQALNRVRS